MNDAATPDESLLRDKHIENLCNRFERRLRDGEQPRIEEVLKSAPDVDVARLLSELIASEIEFRCGNGESPTAAEYVRRFPQFADTIGEFVRKQLETIRFKTGETTRVGVPSDSIDTKIAAAKPPAATTTPQARRFGQYELIEEIARGGMGVVYKARQSGLNRIVALKMIKSGTLADRDEIIRFHVEAEAAAQLDHPGIVPIFEVGELGGQHYFSMAYVEGPSLKDALQDGPLPPRDAAWLVKSLAEAVQYAHDKGIVHRDLKPANVLLAVSDQRSAISEDTESAGSQKLNADSRKLTAVPRITDFGLAKNLSAGDSGMTATGQIMGTPSYMPPEQARGDASNIGRLSDVYSLGAILYTLLTGRPPFQAATVVATLKQVVEQEPVSPRRLNPAVDRDLETICLQCLEKEPSQRPESASRLTSYLNDFLHGRPLPIRPVGRLESAWRWSKRHPAKAVSAATTAVAVMALIGLSVAFAYQRQLQDAYENVDDARGRLQSAYDDLEGKKGEVDGLLARETSLRTALDAKNEENKSLLTFRKVTAALENVQRGEIKAAARDLDSCEPRFRGWEWHYVDRLCHPAQRSFEGRLFLFLPRQNRLFTVFKRTINVVDGKSGTTLKTFPAAISQVSVSPDGRLLAIREWKKPTRIVDIAAGTSRPLPGQFDTIAFQPHGRHIACVVHKDVPFGNPFGPPKKQVTTKDERVIEFIDSETGKATANVRIPGAIEGMAFTNDGGRLFAASSRAVHIWNVALAKLDRTIESDKKLGTDAPFSFTNSNRLSLDASGKRVAVVCTDRSIRVWDTQSKRPPLELRGHKTEVQHVRFGPGGVVLASSGEDGRICLWDAATGAPLQTIAVPSKRTHAIAFSPDGKWLAAGGSDSVVRVWSTHSGKQVRQFAGHTKMVAHLAFAPDSSRIYSGSFDRTTQVWELSDGGRQLGPAGKFHSKFHLSRNGEFVAFADSPSLRARKPSYAVEVFNARTGRRLFTPIPMPGPVAATAISPGAGMVAILLYRGTVRLHDLKTGRFLRELRGEIIDRAKTIPGHAVAFGPQNKRLAAGGPGGTVNIWDLKSGKLLHSVGGKQVNVWSLAFTPDGGRILTGGGKDTSVRVWNLKSGRELKVLKGARFRLIRNIDVSPDGNLAIACDGTTTCVWNLKSGKLVAQLEDAEPRTAVFSKDGSRIITAGEDYIRCWETRTFRDALTIRKPGPWERAAFDRSGRELVVVGSDGRAIRCNASPVRRQPGTAR